MFAMGKGKEWWNWLTVKIRDSFYSPLRLPIYYFKFWCLKVSNKGLITAFLTPFGRAPSWFPFSITSWKLVFLAAAQFGLNQIMQIPPRWPMKVSIRMESQEYWRKTSWVGSSICLFSSHLLLHQQILGLAARSLCAICILHIRGCRKWILLSQMPEGPINQTETGVFQVRGSIFCSTAVKSTMPCQGWLTGGYPPFINEW